MVDELFDSPTFSLRTREVAILRVAHLQGSRYELSQHIGIARTAGLTERQINAILDDGDLERPTSATPNASCSTSSPNCAPPIDSLTTRSPRATQRSVTRRSRSY